MMVLKQHVGDDKRVYYRLVALWAVCEAFLGGMIHGLKLPVSGLLVGSCAILCISFIGWYVPSKGAIIKATIVVATCKLMLSPQSPPPAYIAVFFQGLLAEMLFSNKKYFRFACVLFGGLALLESALQRILVMTILYGKNLWVVIDEFIRTITRQQTATPFSYFLIGMYVVLHLIVGLVIGFYAGKWIVKTQESSLLQKADIIKVDEHVLANNIVAASHTKHRFIKSGFFVLWFCMVVLLLQSWLHIGTPLLPKHLLLQLLFRSVLIVLSWYFLVSPLIMWGFKKWLSRHQQKAASDIAQVLLLLPSIQYIIKQSWKMSSDAHGIGRLSRCSKIVLMNIIMSNYE